MSEPIVLEIRDGSNRDLLAEPEPVRVAVTGESTAMTLRVRSSSPLQLALSSDQGWLRPAQPVMHLTAGQTAELRLTADGTGSGEFAVLEVAWSGADGALAEHVLVQRQRIAAPKPAPVQKPSPGTTALPDWMR